ncbi:hypothetical protein ACRAWG_08480 [Methylobacterium sp. P31]
MAARRRLGLAHDDLAALGEAASRPERDEIGTRRTGLDPDRFEAAVGGPDPDRGRGWIAGALPSGRKRRAASGTLRTSSSLWIVSFTRAVIPGSSRPSRLSVFSTTV